MPRPKLDDPKVPVSLRLPKSVKEAWDAAAERKGSGTGRQLMEAKLIEAVTGPARPPVQAPVDGHARDVTPNFRNTK